MGYRAITLALATTAAVALVGVAGYSQTARIAASVTEVKIPDRVDNFRLTDHASRSYELYRMKRAPAIVVVSHRTGSAHLAAAAPTLKKMQADYAARGVKFFLMDSSPEQARDALAKELASLGLDIPVLMDDTQLVGESLGVSRLAEAFVIEPKTWKVVYSGPIDNRFAGKSPKPKAKAKPGYLAAALDAVLAGQPVAAQTVALDTPGLSFPNRDRKADFVNISYTDQVAPILEKNCVACHSVGGIGPFAMNSYDMVKGFAPMIRESLRTDRMPPYNADPHVGTFGGSMNMDNRDIQTIVHWIEAGAPRGGGEDPLKIHAKPAPEWELGEPDLVITLPSYKVPASGVVDYQNPVVANPLTEGRWLRAATVKPSDRQAVHHLLSNGVGGYAVGAETTTYPKGLGSWVAPGQQFRFQMHYTPYGKETVETTRVGLYFYPKDQPPQLMRRSTVVLNAGIEIPPNAAAHEEVAYITFPHDATLFTVFPHAHYRGKSMAVSMQRPGEKEELIVSLPNYDFNWQRGYDFATPINLPAGSRVITRYVYDNSADNPANPDPSIKVTWGEQSWEEMQYTALGFRWNDETVASQKPEYMADLNASRTLGSMDHNLDGKVQKAELSGRMGQMIGANFEKMDADSDGGLNQAELAPIARMMNRRLEEAAAQQSVGQ
jgi:peroxiredoxin